MRSETKGVLIFVVIALLLIIVLGGILALKVMGIDIFPKAEPAGSSSVGIINEDEIFNTSEQAQKDTLFAFEKDQITIAKTQAYADSYGNNNNGEFTPKDLEDAIKAEIKKGNPEADDSVTVVDLENGTYQITMPSGNQHEVTK